MVSSDKVAFRRKRRMRSVQRAARAGNWFPSPSTISMYPAFWRRLSSKTNVNSYRLHSPTCIKSPLHIPVGGPAQGVAPQGQYRWTVCIAYRSGHRESGVRVQVRSRLPSYLLERNNVQSRWNAKTGGKACRRLAHKRSKR